MMELMSQEALRLGAERRQELALSTMHDVRASEGMRRSAGGALIALGKRVAGEIATGNRELEPTSNRV